MNSALSQSPRAIRQRELRLDKLARTAESEMNAEVGAFMAQGMTFDEAWIASGGLIIPDISVKR